MPIRKFELRNYYSLRLAACNNVPRFMVIVGPNGVGTSQILKALAHENTNNSDFDVQESGDIRFLGANRVLITQSFTARDTMGDPVRYQEALANPTFESPQGMQQRFGGRDQSVVYETGNFIAYSLAQLAQRAVAARSDYADSFPADQPYVPPPDIFAPLAEVVRRLLPYLEFTEPDLRPDGSVRVGFIRQSWMQGKAASRSIVPLEDLSSGEKEILLIAYQFVEPSIERNLNELESSITESGASIDLCIIIDEPELHLHPALQVALISFLREQASELELQFIIATQSPAIIDSVEEGELYYLAEPNLVGSPKNQLHAMSGDTASIKLIREITGDVAVVTSGRILICVEGERSDRGKDRVTDRRILEILCPELKNIALLPKGGKSQVISNAGRLRSSLPTTLDARVYALVDSDQSSPGNRDLSSWVVPLPVSMLENLLLDLEILHKVLCYFKAIEESTTVKDVQAMMASITKKLYDSEIEIRVRHGLTQPRIGLKGTSVASLKKSAAEAHDQIDTALGSDSRLSAIVETARMTVDNIIASRDELKGFHGKNVLRALYRDYGPGSTVSYSTFVLQLAHTTSLRQPMVITELRHKIAALINP